MKIGGKIAFAVIILAGAAAGGFYGYRQANKETDLSAIYQTEAAGIGEVSRTVSDTGTVAGLDEVSIYIQSPQTVSRVNVKEGDMVDEGRVLVEYDIAQDKRELERKLREAELNLASAHLSLELIAQPASGNDLLAYMIDVSTAEKNVYDAENNLKMTEVKITQHQIRLDDAKKAVDNYKKLLDGGVAAQNEYDAAVTAYQSAAESMNNLLLQKEADERNLENRERQLAEAELKLNNAQDKFSNETNLIKYQQQQNSIRLIELSIEQIKDDIEKLTTVSTSPVFGNVSAVGVTAGQTASKSAAVIKLTDMSGIIVKADISEYDAPKLEPGQRVMITTGGLTDAVYNGVIEKIAAGAVPKDKSADADVIVPVEITVLNADERLKPGYTVNIVIYIEEKNDVLNVPLTAVVAENGIEYVYTLENNELIRNEVITGLKGDKSAEIIRGLKAGDNVVTEPSK